jgi:DNA processing protein
MPNTSPESPILFYFKGHLKEIKQAIGIVGSRRCTAYGRKIAEEIGVELAQHGISLVSGFAKGIDSYTQAACINHGGYTALFLAGGVDICYPLEQQSLYFKTLEHGGVFLLQFPPGTKPHPKQFLRRNAFISAWSIELVVVEASEQSGALWTADFAKKHGKQVYAVPHPISSFEGKGCNLLLSKGAKPYLGWQSLTPLLNKCEHHINSTPTNVLDPILQIITNSPTSISKLSHELNMSESMIMDKLLTLELQGKLIVRGNMVSTR